MSRFAHSAHRVRPGVAALTTATALLAVCAVQWAPTAGAAQAPADGTAPSAGCTQCAGGSEPGGL
ncbi:hypothetical protein, partial [Streptomyces diastatochromogenes]|uniref:hypothetical protein n=1 Tax=Streptomyces diastatochromogenes TaxID=42236 RepID=UPI00369E71CA